MQISEDAGGMGDLLEIIMAFDINQQSLLRLVDVGVQPDRFCSLRHNKASVSE